MTRSELAALVAEKRQDISRKNAHVIVDTIFDSMGQALVDGDRIEVRGFGSFEVRQHSARVGRNPRTGQEVQIAGRRVARFRVGKALRERINKQTH